MDNQSSNADTQQRANATTPRPFSEQDPDDSIDGGQRSMLRTLKDQVASRQFNDKSN